jgi:hypothetical protein
MEGRKENEDKVIEEKRIMSKDKRVHPDTFGLRWPLWLLHCHTAPQQLTDL